MRPAVPMTEIFCSPCRRTSLVRRDSSRLCFNCGVTPGSARSRPVLIPHVACPDCNILHAGRNVGAPLCAKCKNNRNRHQVLLPVVDSFEDYYNSSLDSFIEDFSDGSELFYGSSDDEEVIGSLAGSSEIQLMSLRLASLSIGRPVPPSVLRLLERGFADTALCHCECPICLKHFAVAEAFIKLGCAHTYHEECIERWLTGHNTCPLCRSRVN